MPKKKPRTITYWGRVIDELTVQRDAAIAGNTALRRKLDEANATLEATKDWRARVSAEATKAQDLDRATIMRYAERETELRDELQRALNALRNLGFTYHAERGWQPVPGPAPQESENFDQAMHALRATPFGQVACEGIVRAIAAYVNPRSRSDRSTVGEVRYGSDPAATQTRDR